MSATTSYDLTSFRLLCPGVRLVLPVDGKQQRQGSDGLFSSRQVLHGHEALPRRHAAVADAAEVRLVWVLWAQDGLEGRKQALGGQAGRRCPSVTVATGCRTESKCLSVSVGVCRCLLQADLSAAVPADPLVDLVDDGGHVLQAAHEPLQALRLDPLELQAALPGGRGAGLEGCGDERTDTAGVSQRRRATEARKDGTAAHLSSPPAASPSAPTGSPEPSGWAWCCAAAPPPPPAATRSSS